MKKFLQFILPGCFLCLSVSIQATPANNSDRARSLAQSISIENCPNCAPNGQDRDLCESCAKVTKNEYVFPLCCANKDNVRDYCREYINFSMQ